MKVEIDIPDDLYQKFKEKAAADNLTTDKVILYIVNRYVSGRLGDINDNMGFFVEAKE